MDKLENYRQAVRQLLSRFVKSETGDEEIESQLIFDDERGHYQWLELGWKDSLRMYHCFVHIDIRDGKVWLQRNMTDQDLAEDLVEMGVLRKDIV
ncbi:MAG: XisI protein, partial [Phormidesmis sp.]